MSDPISFRPFALEWEALLKCLRENGVTHFEGLGVKVAFRPDAVKGPERPAAAPSEPADRPLPRTPTSESDIDAKIRHHIERTSPTRFDGKRS